MFHSFCPSVRAALESRHERSNDFLDPTKALFLFQRSILPLVCLVYLTLLEKKSLARLPFENLFLWKELVYLDFYIQKFM